VNIKTCTQTHACIVWWLFFQQNLDFDSRLVHHLQTEQLVTSSFRPIDWVGLNDPLNTLLGHIGDGFLQVKWPNQQCQSTEGSSGPNDQASIPPGPPHHVTILHMHVMYSQTQNNTYTKMNLSTVKWAQWDKTQFRELLGLFICVCSSLCTTVAHNTAQNRHDNFPSCPPDTHHYTDDVYLRERVNTSSFRRSQ